MTEGKRRDDDWRTALDEFSADLKGRLATRREYEDSLSALLRQPECPVAKLDIRGLQATKPAIALTVGVGAGGGAATTERWALELGGTSWVVEAWPSEGTTSEQTIDRDEIRTILDCFWKSAERDKKSRLVSLQYPKTRMLIDNYLRWVSNKRRSVACFYADLDHFKEVNDKLGHDVGDAVILTWSRMVERLVGLQCVVLHRSGDEFVLLCPNATTTSAVAVAIELMSATAKTDFGVGNIRVGCSIGIAVCRPKAVPVFEELVGAAERAVVPKDGEKRRGRVSLKPADGAGPAGGSGSRVGLGDGVQGATCVLRSELAAVDVFQSPWLNNVARVVDAAAQGERGLSAIQSAVGEVLPWLPEVRADSFTAAHAILDDRYASTAAPISRIDIGLAVARGIFVCTLRRPAADEPFEAQLQHTGDGRRVQLEVRRGDEATVVWRWPTRGRTGGPWESVDLGEFAGLGLAEMTSIGSGRRACLVKIGHEELEVLGSSLFAEVITVDDRPTRGGQLPDFWEATVARVIALLGGTRTLQFLYILGNARYGGETIGRLKAAAAWKADVELMSYKTGRPPSEV
ncbi:MAG: GGDEF domain-containing protein, partial [Gammaproteobacteria bacterium]|nr:GGDEF domain-containing protein [Gammaproteobacteria bacterium]